MLSFYRRLFVAVFRVDLTQLAGGRTAPRWLR